MHAPAHGQLYRVEHALAEQQPDDRQQHPRDRVGERDHLLAPDRVEQRPQDQRPEKIAERERQHVPADRLRRHAIEPAEHQRVGEEDRVVEKRLRRHQHQSEHRALADNRAGSRRSCARSACALPAAIRMRGHASRSLSISAVLDDAALDTGEYRVGIRRGGRAASASAGSPGIHRRSTRMPRPSTAPIPNAARHPNRAAAAPAATARPRRPRRAPRRPRSCR